MNPDLQQTKLVLDGLLINYYYFELKKPKKTLLFLHGWRSNSTVWFKIFPKLFEAGFQIYALDFPGFGKSQTPSEPFALQDYVDIVTQFMNKLEIKKPILIGHSHGGRVGIKLASKQPELLDKLVLIDSGGVKNTATSIQLKKGIAKVVKPVFKLPFMKSIRTKLYQSMGAEDYVATPELTQTFINIVNEDLTPLLHSIQTETLLIWGKDDTDTPLKDATIMKEQIPSSKLEVIPNAGHYSFLDQPDVFLSYLLPFI